jgi:hypothetical protein
LLKKTIQANYHDLNKQQVGNEHDKFTIEGYEQFLKFFKLTGVDRLCIVDIGSNTGRGGDVLRTRYNYAEVIGVNTDEEKPNVISKDLYNKLL